MQYPFLATHFLFTIVNVVTVLDAIKNGVELGGTIQTMRRASPTMLAANLFSPAITLLLTQLFFYGALETGSKLDNPMLAGCQSSTSDQGGSGGDTQFH